MTGSTASECDDRKTRNEDGGKGAIDAYRHEAATAFLGSGNSNGAGGAMSCRHAAILRYADNRQPG